MTVRRGVETSKASWVTSFHAAATACQTSCASGHSCTVCVTVSSCLFIPWGLEKVDFSRPPLYQPAAWNNPRCVVSRVVP